MKNVHICSGVNAFIPPFLDFVSENFSQERNYFFLMYFDKKSPVKNSENVHNYRGLYSFFKIAIMCFKSERIIIHGLFNWRLLIFLFFNKWMLRKTYWLIWGGDLYRSDAGLLSFPYQWVKKEIIRRIPYLVTYLPDDVEYARKQYAATGSMLECILYPSNVIKETSSHISNNSRVKNIMIGNSATPTNHHIQILDLFRTQENLGDYKVFCPLSYGIEHYRNQIIANGSDILGENFYPLIDYMPYEKYLKFLNTIDVAIFGHKRQQGMGNIIQLCSLGKTIYFLYDNSATHFLKGLGIKFKYLNEEKIELITFEEASNNIDKIKKYFSQDNLRSQLKCICE